MKKLIEKDIYYIGVNDHQIDLFEGQYIVPNGMAYNSYIIKDEMIAIMDTVDQHFTEEWLKNIANVLEGEKPTYLIIQHMEPDHSANIINFLKKYPDTYVVGNAKTFKMMEQFFHEEIPHKVVVNDGDSLNLGEHVLNFVFAPMVHWPEVMVTYDSFDKVLFSADGKKLLAYPNAKGKKYKISEAVEGVNYPLFHPNCRTVAVLYEGIINEDLIED